MASLNDKQSQLRSTLPVVLVGPGLRISDQLNEENRWLAWKRAWEFIRPAVELDGEHTEETVLAALGRGTRRVWVSATSAVITEAFTYPSGMRIVNGWLAGGNLEEIMTWLPMLEAWGKDNGATKVRINARRGWGRPAGYKEFRYSMTKDL